MKSGGGKQKGAAFERKVCKELSLWISEDERDDLLWRSAMSGGRATVKWKKGEAAQSGGDITATDAAGYKFVSIFSIECKHYKEFSFRGVVYERKQGLPSFWTQCCKDAREQDKLPFLIAKMNNYETIVCFNHLAKAHLDINTDYVRAIFPRYDMHVMLWSDFLSTTPPINTDDSNDNNERSALYGEPTGQLPLGTDRFPPWNRKRLAKK